jgi:Zn-dependent M16 (insulinase) family peptidase
LRQLAQQIDSDWPSVLKILEAIRTTLLTGPNALANVTVDAASWQALQPQISDFLASLPSNKSAEQTWKISPFAGVEGLTIPSQVNFVGKGTDLYKLGYELNGSTFVVNQHLNGTWLWEKIRVLGGAYGGFSTFDSQSGVFNFLSYRDPNLAQTLQNYDLTAQFLLSLELDDAEITKAIIGTIGDMDAYLLPDAKGFTSMRWHLLGTTDQERQKLRDEVLNTSIEDFHAFGRVLDKVKERGEVVALGSDEAIQSAGIFQEITKLL